MRQLATETGGAEAFVRAALCLEVFRERGLLRMQRTGDEIHLTLTDQGKKVSLEDSPYLQLLYQTLETSKRGGAK